MKIGVIGTAILCLAGHAEEKVVGIIEPSATVQVKSLLTGTLVKTYIAAGPGKSVKQGELLFKLDPREYELALAQVESVMERDAAQLRRAEAILARDQAEGKSAAPDVLQQSIRVDEAAIEAARKTIQSDKAAIEKAKLDLSHTEVRAPIDGRAGDLPVDVGNLVKAGETVLVVIVQLQPVVVTFRVPQKYLRAIRTHEFALPTEVSMAGGSANVFRGMATLIDNVVDTQSGTIRLRATIPNPSLALWPGQMVEVRITGGEQ